MQTNKTILITGGTSRIGEAIVKKLLQEGWQVYFTYYHNIALKNELESLGAKGYFLDISALNQVMSFIDAFKAEVKKIDCLINNVALIDDNIIIKMTREAWDKIIFSDFHAPLIIIKEMLNIMPGGGKILNITSQVGQHGAYGQANYATAKGALIEATKTLAFSLAKKNIIINCLNPGFVISAMTDNLALDVKEKNIQKSCFKKVFEVDSIAKFIAFYVSDMFSDISGQVFSIDNRIFD